MSRKPAEKPAIGDSIRIACPPPLHQSEKPVEMACAAPVHVRHSTARQNADPRIPDCPGRLTKAQIQAALLVAEDRLSNARIGHKCGVTARALEKWKLKPEFRAEVDRHKAAWRDQVLSQGLADRAWRVKEAQADYDKLGMVMVERGKDPGMKDVPGGKTGTQLRHVKSLNIGGKDHERKIVAEYETDSGLLQQRANLREQVARELGQWVEEIKHSGSLHVVKRLIGVSEEEI